MEAELIGTMVVDGGRSYAVFELKIGQKLVRTGEEIIRGIRLVRVMRNQIEISLGGVTQEIGQGLVGSMALASATPAVVDMNPYDELRRKKSESLSRFRQLYVGQKRR